MENRTVEFFNLIWRGGTTFTTYHKPKTWKPSKPDQAHWHKSIASATAKLSPTPANSNWWFCVNPSTQIPPANSKGQNVQTIFIGAQNQYIELSNCLFGDFDAKDFGSKEATLAHIEQLVTEPSFIIDSGNGYHCYWLFDEPIRDMKLYSRILRGWIAYVEADSGAKSISRKLRVPGTFNHKDKANPLPVEFIKFAPEISYDISEFTPYALPEHKPIELPTNIEVDTDDYKLALTNLASFRCDDYGEWFAVLCSLKAGLGDNGIGLADDWSQQSDNYDSEIFLKTWNAIQNAKEDGITENTIFGLFKIDSRVNFDEWQSSKAPLLIGDDTMFLAYPEQAKGEGFDLNQCLEFETTGQIAELEAGDVKNEFFDDPEIVTDYEGEIEISEKIAGLTITDFTKPNVNPLTIKVSNDTVTGQDIAYVMSELFDAISVKTSLNGAERAIPYFYNKKYGWTNDYNIFMALARYAYSIVRANADRNFFEKYRAENINKFIVEIKQSLAGYLDDASPLINASPRHIARDKTSYINMANGKRIKPQRNFITTKFMLEYPEVSKEFNEVVSFLWRIFGPKELKQDIIEGKLGRKAKEYFDMFCLAIGQTFCNETNPRQFHYVYGKPSSGKGLFVRFNKFAFQELVQSSLTPALLKKDGDGVKLQEIGKLDGALAGFIPDMKDVKLNENINGLVGDGYAQGKQLYVGLIDVPIRYTLWLMSNYPPELSDDAITARAWVWFIDNEFDNEFNGSDEYLKSLVPQYVRFVQYCIEQYLNIGLKQRPQYMVDHINEIRIEADSCQSFINSHIKLDPTGAIPQKWLYEKYLLGEDPMKKSLFKKAILSLRGVYQKRTQIKNDRIVDSGVAGLDNDSVTNGHFYCGLKFFE